MVSVRLGTVVREGVAHVTAKAVLVHGGGPTAVWNASLAGLVLESRRVAGLPRLYGARWGMAGLLREEWVDLEAQPEELVARVGETPGSAIGSSRHAMQEDDYGRAAEVLRRNEIRVVFLNGGNGTMRTARRLQEAAGERVQVIGIPKTIDNDIPGTDHTPGYGSAARFFAHAARDAGEDNRSLPSPVMVLETLGRDTGWITAATALARTLPDDAPHLTYLPERPIALEAICGHVRAIVAKWGRCVITVCEGQKDELGNPFGADVQRDRDGRQRLAANLGHTLAGLIQERTGLRTRSEKPGLTGRSSGVLASERDRADAFACGAAAARAAREGARGCMVRLDHSGETGLVSLEQVTPGLREFPQEWINAEGNGVTKEYLEWVRPLAGEVASFPRLLDL